MRYAWGWRRWMRGYIDNVCMTRRRFGWYNEEEIQYYACSDTFQFTTSLTFRSQPSISKPPRSSHNRNKSHQNAFPHPHPRKTTPLTLRSPRRTKIQIPHPNLTPHNQQYPTKLQNPPQKLPPPPYPHLQPPKPPKPPINLPPPQPPSFIQRRRKEHNFSISNYPRHSPGVLP